MATGDVSVQLDLEAKALYNELTAVQSRFASFASKVTGEGEKAGKGFVGGFRASFTDLGRNIAGALATLGIGRQIGDLVEYASKVQDLHERYGVAAETLQRFGNAAELNGSSIEAVGKAFRFLEVNQAKALAGNEGMIAAFRNLGVSVNDLRTLSPEQIMLKIGGSSLNAADTVKILGKSALDLRPILAGIADGTIALGAAISALDIAKIDQIGDQFKQIQQTVRIGFADALAYLATEWQVFWVDIVAVGAAAIEEVKGVFAALKAVVTGYEIKVGPFGVPEIGKKEGSKSPVDEMKEAHERAKEVYNEVAKARSEFRNPEQKAARPFGLPPEEAGEGVAYDDQGRPISKSEAAAGKKAAKAEAAKTPEQKAEDARLAEIARQRGLAARYQKEQFGTEDLTGVDIGQAAKMQEQIDKNTAYWSQAGMAEAIGGGGKGLDWKDQLKQQMGDQGTSVGEGMAEAIENATVLAKIEENTRGIGANK